MLQVGNQKVVFRVHTDDLSPCANNIFVTTTHPQSALNWAVALDGVPEVKIGKRVYLANREILETMAYALEHGIPLKLRELMADMQEI